VVKVVKECATEDQPPPWWLVLVIASLALIAGGVLALAATLAWLLLGLAA
jgi:hypothetical protein